MKILSFNKKKSGDFMKDNFLKTISALMVFSVVIGLCACTKKDDASSGVITTNRPLTSAGDETTTKSTAAEAVSAVAPKSEEDSIKFYNSAIKVFQKNSYNFSVKKECTLKSFSAGTLSTVDGATESYKSMLKSSFGDMMGVGTSRNSYYVGDDISTVFTLSEISAESISGITAEANGANVVIKVNLLKNSDDGMTEVSSVNKDCMTNEKFSTKIKDYSATADSSSVKHGAVTVTAEIDYVTRNFVGIQISYSSQFSAENVKLSYVSGGPVTGTTNTKITFGDFKEE